MEKFINLETFADGATAEEKEIDLEGIRLVK